MGHGTLLAEKIVGWWINGFIGVVSAYVLWTLFVLLYIRSLNEIKKSSFLFRFATSDYWFIKNTLCIENSCDYGKALLMAPIVWCIGLPIATCFMALVIVILMALKTITKKILFPCITGYVYPPSLFSLVYWRNPFGILSNPEKYFATPPVAYLLLAAIAFEMYRVYSGNTSFTETVLFLSIVTVSELILVGIFAFTRSSVKGALKAFRERVCVTLPTVD